MKIYSNDINYSDSVHRHTHFYVKYPPNYSVDLNASVLHDCSTRKELIAKKRCFLAKVLSVGERLINLLTNVQYILSCCVSLCNFWSNTFAIITLWRIDGTSTLFELACSYIGYGLDSILIRRCWMNKANKRCYNLAQSIEFGVL